MAGDNATVLHYKSNNHVIESGDLVLVDAGCEVSGMHQILLEPGQ